MSDDGAAATPTPSIEIDGVGKRYVLYRNQRERVRDLLRLTSRHHDTATPRGRGTEMWALRGIHLRVDRGERVGLVGRNGAGKSTLLKIITGALAPSEGTVTIHGRIQALLELGTGFHPEFTGRENVRVSLGYLGLGHEAIAAAELEIIDFAELDQFIDQPVRTYSAGMYARLAFATATVVEPEILVIDEVLGAGDAYFAGKSISRMKNLTVSSGATVLFVSHDLESVQRLCTRVVWIDHGTVVDDGEPLAVVKRYMAQVRRDEERRLRQRDGGAGGAVAPPAALEEVLFRLVPDPVSATEHAVVSSVTLRHLTDDLGSIAVGAPQDNNTDLPHHLLTDPRYMEWGPSVGGDGQWGRAVGNRGGSYGHAPFTFRVDPLALREPIELVITATVHRPVRVELWRDGAYQPVGALLPSDAPAEQVLSVDMLGVTSTAKPTPLVRPTPDGTRITADRYGDGSVQVASVDWYDATGAPTRVLTSGQPARLAIDLAGADLARPMVVVCTSYLPDGQCASQWFGELEPQPASADGVRHALFDVTDLRLGPGAYVASIGVFERLGEDGLGHGEYDVLERCLHFVVERPPGDRVDGGLVRQDYRFAEVTSVER